MCNRLHWLTLLQDLIGLTQFPVLALKLFDSSLLGTGRSRPVGPDDPTREDCLANSPICWRSQHALPHRFDIRHDAPSPTCSASICQRPNHPQLAVAKARPQGKQSAGLFSDPSNSVLFAARLFEIRLASCAHEPSPLLHMTLSKERHKYATGPTCGPMPACPKPGAEQGDT